MALPFPAALPLNFGADFVPAETSVDGTALEWVASHCEDGKELLLAQFKGKPRLEAALCALLEPVQELDDAAWQILVGRSLDSAIGVQLDGIGQIVDLPRVGWTDDQYRRFLRGQTFALRSSGTWPDMFAILGALGFTLSLIDVEEPNLATELLPVASGGDRAWLRIQANQPAFDGLAADVFAMLVRAKPAGVRMLFEVSPAAGFTAFTYATGSGGAPGTSSTLGYSSSIAASGGAYASVLASSTGA